MNSYKEDLRISIIVPIFNVEKYLVRCLDSIVNQTYRNLEIILIDDGSTDKSLDICRNYEEKDERIKVIHVQNSGLVEARKTGIRNATGTYITFVDADDYIDLDSYRFIMEAADKRLPDIIAYGLIEEYPDYSVKKGNYFQEGLYQNEELKEKIFPQMLSNGTFFDYGVLPNLVCKFIKREFLEHTPVAVNSKITVGEDADLTFQLIANAKSIQFANSFPYHYCKRNDSMMWRGIAEGSITELENDLTRAFNQADCLEIMQEQLDDYMTFVSLLKKPELILDDWDIFKNKRIALYGAGGFGQAVQGVYGDSITLWVDKNFVRYKNAGLQVNAVDDLLAEQAEYDVIFIAILNTRVCKSVKNYLQEQGIEKEIYYYER